MRYTKAKARLCRSYGENLFNSPKYDKIMERKPYGPGMHGQKRSGKRSGYANQLREKQKAKRVYGLSEKQFKRYALVAIRSQLVTGEALVRGLETRLDNVIYRSGLALTRAQARQMVSHGTFCVGDQRVTIPSFAVKVGDKIAVRTQAKGSPLWKKNFEVLADYQAPEWLSVQPKSLSIEVIAQPEIKHLEPLVQPRVITEFYSR